jgi:hypothetical protein
MYPSTYCTRRVVYPNSLCTDLLLVTSNVPACTVHVLPFWLCSSARQKSMYVAPVVASTYRTGVAVVTCARRSSCFPRSRRTGRRRECFLLGLKRNTPPAVFNVPYVLMYHVSSRSRSAFTVLRGISATGMSIQLPAPPCFATNM